MKTELQSAREATASEEHRATKMETLLFVSSHDVAEASCQFHFIQAVDGITKDFSSNENFKIFSNMAIGMMNEELQEVFWGLFDECMRMLANMRNEDKGVTAACGFLRWHFLNKGRRERVVTAFKPLRGVK
jgi:hypothetical protein